MVLFYAYAKLRNGIPEHARYLVVFASRDVADEWWRTVSSANITRSIIRVAPQYYTFEKNGGIDAITLSVDRDRFPQFESRVFITLLDDAWGRQLSIVPIQDITDHVSGNSFFIRSKADPPEYWYCPTTSGDIIQSTKVYASREERTRFRVRIADEHTIDGTIMIGTDEITISPVSAIDLSVGFGVGGGRMMVASGPQPRLKLSDLRNGFTGASRCLIQVETDHNLSMYYSNVLPDRGVIVAREIIRAQEHMGDEWELA